MVNSLRCVLLMQVQAKADELGITRSEMDEFALASLAKAQAAIANGAFDNEITAVEVTNK